MAHTAAMSAPQQLLRSIYGYDAFRPGQEEIVDHLVAGGDALVVMPTGSGKSMCYQLPSLARPGVGVVISPLIALMRNQVQAMLQVGVHAALLNSTLSAFEARGVEEQLLAGGLDLLYVAPERLMTERCLELLSQARIALFAIDEAHCVSQWGHDFRPEYLQLDVLAERFPGVPRVALTATADEATRADIVERLRLHDGRVFVSGFDRPNIRYEIVEKDSARAQLLRFLRDRHGADTGIVYCLSRKRVEEVASFLAGEGLPAIPYHAGLDAEVRRRNQDRFLMDEHVIVVATIAFGMGIDRPDVRFVAHLDLPKSIEAYYQETGRAGRDGLPSDAWMTYGLADVVTLRQMLLSSEADERHKRVENAKLDALLGFCETTRCRRQVLLEYFGEPRDEPCGNCDTCLEPVRAWDGTVAAQKALSAVYRTGQRFGTAYLVDVLTGNGTDRLLRNGHHELPTFGVGADLSKQQWHSIFRQLVAAGLLSVDVTGHGGMSLTPRALPVLKGEQPLSLRTEPARRARQRAKPAKAAVTADLTPQEQVLFEALRAKRAELAREQGLPAYVVCHDATLRVMARERPRDEASMLRVHGMGESRVARYGQAFLEVLR